MLCSDKKTVLFLFVVFVVISVINGDRFPGKRSAAPDDNMDQAESSLDKIQIRYDEYPVRFSI